MSSSKTPELPSWPKQLTLVNTSACNLSCFMCFTNGPLVESSHRSMPISLLSSIVREAGPHVESISLTNWGEPFCDPNLPAILKEIALFPKVALTFQTNGTLLDSFHLQLLNGQPNPIRFNISVDALDPVVYASIRPPANLSALLRNLRSLRQYAADLDFKIDFIELNATLSLRNIAFAPSLVEFASTIGANGVRLLHIGAIHPSLKDESLYRFPVYTNGVLDHCRALAAERGLVLNCAQPFAITDEEILRAKPDIMMCDMIDSMLQISPTGEVWPCCGNLPLIGKLPEAGSIAEIWGNSEHERLREGIWSGNPVGACKTCRYLERLTPYLYDSILVGVDIHPDERCMDPHPDFESLGAFEWLDDLSDSQLRRSVRSGLIDAMAMAPLRVVPQKSPFFQRLEAFLVRWARSQPFIMDNPMLVRNLSLVLETLRRVIRRC